MSFRKLTFLPAETREQFEIRRIEPDFTGLWIDGICQMNDLPPEDELNRQFCEVAHGAVLIAGLGLGFVLTWILGKPEVQSVTVVEKHQAIIEMVGPHFQHPKLTIINADIFGWEPTPEQKFDTIWNDISLEVLDQLESIKEKQLTWLAPHGWFARWSLDGPIIHAGAT